MNRIRNRSLALAGPIPAFAEDRSSLSGGTSRSAFTLIELLTVIAIIGILAAILIPVVSQVREQGNRTVCRSNIRQQLYAMHLFAEDHFWPDPATAMQSEPPIGYWTVWSASDDNAPVDLYPDYVDDVELFICPSTQNRIRMDHRSREGRLVDLERNASGGREDSRGGHSYEYLGIYSGHWEYGPAGVKNPLSAQGYESITMLIVDGDDTPGQNNCPDASNNHRADGWNWGFADGHVEWVSRERTNEYLQRSGHAPWCRD